MELYRNTLFLQKVNKHNLHAISYIRETLIVFLRHCVRSTVMNYTKASEKAEYEMISTITWLSIEKYSKFICILSSERRTSQVEQKFKKNIHLPDLLNGKKERTISTSLNAPIRGSTLVSFFIRLTNSLGIGELKYTNALQKRKGTTIMSLLVLDKSLRSQESRFCIVWNLLHTSCIKVLFLTCQTKTWLCCNTAKGK